jgi:hypothetical protein
VIFGLCLLGPERPQNVRMVLAQCQTPTKDLDFNTAQLDCIMGKMRWVGSIGGLSALLC